LCGHFENDSISPLRTTRFLFENDSISHPAETSRRFRLDFFAKFLARKSQGGQIGHFHSRTPAFHRHPPHEEAMKQSSTKFVFP